MPRGLRGRIHVPICGIFGTGRRIVLMLNTTSADLAPLETDLRVAFGDDLAGAPIRALQLASGSCQAAGRTEACERAMAVARLLLVQGADPETIAASLISQAIPDAELDLEA